jgi:hypothetical protein
LQVKGISTNSRIHYFYEKVFAGKFVIHIKRIENPEFNYIMLRDSCVKLQGDRRTNKKLPPEVHSG